MHANVHIPNCQPVVAGLAEQWQLTQRLLGQKRWLAMGREELL